MNHNLQTKQYSVYLQYISTGNNLNVEASESEITGDSILVKLTLSADDRPQQVEKLQSISIDDQQVIERFIDHVKSSPVDISTYKIELIKKEDKQAFTVTPTLTTQGDLRALCFMVHTS